MPIIAQLSQPRAKATTSKSSPTPPPWRKTRPTIKLVSVPKRMPKRKVDQQTRDLNELTADEKLDSLLSTQALGPAQEARNKVFG